MADALGTPPAAATPTVGVVSAIDHRLALAGLIAPQTSSLAVRTGVLVAPGSNALITGTSATGTMTVNIAPHHWVTTRGTADGIYLGTKETSTTVNIAAAPGANSRIDVVYAKQNDSASAISPDGSTGEFYGVVTGTAAASPVKPALPLGAVEIGTITVAVGATNTLGAGVTISNTGQQTTMRGGIVPVKTQAERVALTGYPTMQVLELDNGRLLWHDGTRFRYHADLVTVSNTSQRDALTSYEGLSALVTGAGKFLYTASAWIKYNQWEDLLRSTTYNFTPANGSAYVDLSSSNYTITGLPPGRELEVEWKAPVLSAPASASLFLRLLIASVQTDTIVISTGSAPMFGPGRLTGSAVVPSSGTLLVQVQGYSGPGAALTPIQATAGGVGGGAVVLRFRVR